MQEETKTAKTEESREETYIGDFIKFDVFLVDFFKAFKRFWWTAVVFVAVLCTVAFFYCKKEYKPTYTAQASFSISAENTSSIASGASSFSSYYNSGVAEQLSKTFSYIINSETMRSILYERLGTSSLNGTVSAKNNVESVPIFTITVNSPSPEDAYSILEAVIENYPRLAQYIIGETQMTIFTKPKMPTEPSNPFSCKKEMIIAAAVGLFLSMMIMTVYAFTRNTVRQRDDIKTKLNQKCLVEVPWVNVKKRKNNAETMVTISQKHAGFSEAFRYLKRRVVNHLDRHSQKVVAVTSSFPGEGKTTVSYNLALSIAQSGKKVALLDMDFSRKSLQKYLSAADPQKPGIIDFIYHKCEIKDIITRSDYGMDIFFAGNGKAKKFQIEDYDALLDYVRENYEYVIMDAAPTAIVSDTAQIMSRADEVLFVLRQDYTPVEKVRESIRYVYDVDAKIMGFVFNAVSEGFEGYKGSYYGYYGSYYGRKYSYYGGKRYGGYGKKYGYSGYGSGYGYGYGRGSDKKKGYGYGYGSESRGYGYGYGYGGTDGGEFIKERNKGENEE